MNGRVTSNNSDSDSDYQIHVLGLNNGAPEIQNEIQTHAKLLQEILTKIVQEKVKNNR